MINPFTEMLNREDNKMWRSRCAANDWRNHFLWVSQNELQLQETRNTRVQGRNIQMQEAAILRSVHPWKKKLSHKVRGHLGMVSASMQMRVRLIQVFLSFFQIELQAFFSSALFLFMPCHSAHSFTFVVSLNLFSFCTKKVNLSMSFRNGGNS